MQHQMWKRFVFVASAITLAFFAPTAVMGQVTFDWLTVGDVGNAADNETIATKGPFTSPAGPQETPGDDTTGYGAVDYEFQIARTHVTTSQYVEFLNAVDPGGDNTLNVYDSRMTTRLHPVSGLNLQAEAGGVNFDASAADLSLIHISEPTRR